ncbi:adenylate cyclase 1 [Abditibacteriota bacterium]|nr:adenylate cyclase 1 [Abditibacteriota bacterium]
MSRAPQARQILANTLHFLDQRWIHFLLIAGLMTGAATAMHQSSWSWLGLEALDYRAIDGYFVLRGAKTPADVAGYLPQTKDIILVEMRHNVPRPLLAKMLDKLRLAKVVAFDLTFRDNENELEEDEKEWYRDDIHKWQQDTALLAASVRANGRVVLGTWPENQREPDKDTAGRYHSKQRWLKPPELLWKSARSLGHLNVGMGNDPQDQTIRFVNLFENTPQQTPCFGLAIAALAKKIPPQSLSNSKGNSLLIDYVGGRECFEYDTNRIVYERVLDLYEPEDFKNKIVIVGQIDDTAKDILSTPFGKMPGMQIHANIVATLLNSHSSLRILELWPTIFIAWSACLLLAVLLLRLPLWLGSLAALAQIVLLFLAGAQIFTASHRVLELSLPAMAVFLTYNAIALYEYRRARETLGKFIGREMVAQTLQVFSRLQLGGRTEEASAFFCDVRGYSTLSEMRSPAEITRVVNEYTSTLARVMKKHQGRLIDYQGDGVFVLFERSFTGENYAEKAVRAAMELQEVFEQLRREWAQSGAPELEIGIGIETGLMTIGIVGAKERMMFSALGHAVNVAARVQGLTGQCGHDILITQNTFEQIQAVISTIPCGSHTVKGLQQPVAVYGVPRSTRERHEEKAQ